MMMLYLSLIISPCLTISILTFAISFQYLIVFLSILCQVICTTCPCLPTVWSASMYVLSKRTLLISLIKKEKK